MEMLHYVACDDWYVFAVSDDGLWYHYNSEMSGKWVDAVCTKHGISEEELWKRADSADLLHDITQEENAVEKHIVSRIQGWDWSVNARYGIFSQVNEKAQKELDRDWGDKKKEVLGRECDLCGKEAIHHFDSPDGEAWNVCSKCKYDIVWCANCGSIMLATAAYWSGAFTTTYPHVTGSPYCPVTCDDECDVELVKESKND